MILTEKLEFAYQTNKKILDRIDFQAEKGHCTAILGNNGAGKSTLLKCLNHILSPKNGAVYLDGKRLGEMKRKQIARHIAYVSQKSESNRFTVYDVVLLGRMPYIKLNPSEEDCRIVDKIIEQMDLKKMSLHYLDELSGGELQKVMLARALAQQPEVLLLDEPTSSLDLKNQYEMLTLIKRLAQEQNICVILVIHDLNLALRYCDRFLLLKDSSVHAYGSTEIMTEKLIEEVYHIPVSVVTIDEVPMIIPKPDI